VQRPIATTRSATGIPTGRLAIWWVIASEIVIFGGLLASYIMHRIGHPEWAIAQAHTHTLVGATNTFVLLTASFTAVKAHEAADKGDGARAGKFLIYTTIGAFLFLTIKSFEWASEIREGFTIQANGFWAFYYTAAGLHALHVLAGAIVMIIIARDAFKGRELQRVEYVGIYWHFVDVIWIFLFPLLYIAK
jgi:heme/copper-type cytochrome/quinol oxidase subunit 3